MSLALADELFLMSHDLRSGKPRVPEVARGIGLAAGLLAELVFAGSIVISEERLARGEYGAPNERLGKALYDEARSQMIDVELTVRGWLSTHRHRVAELVADRLIRSGDLRRVVTRRFGRDVVRYYPTKPPEALIRAQRLLSYQRLRVEMTEPDVVAATLAQLMAQGTRAMDLDAAARDYVAHLLPTIRPPLWDLLSITESLILATMRNPRG